MSYMLRKVVEKLTAVHCTAVFLNIKVSAILLFILKMQNLHSKVKVYVHVMWVRVKSLKSQGGCSWKPSYNLEREYVEVLWLITRRKLKLSSDSSTLWTKSRFLNALDNVHKSEDYTYLLKMQLKSQLSSSRYETDPYFFSIKPKIDMGLFVDFCVFTWIWLNLPDQNLKLFCFDVQNNFMFQSGKFSQI